MFMNSIHPIHPAIDGRTSGPSSSRRAALLLVLMLAALVGTTASPAVAALSSDAAFKADLSLLNAVASDPEALSVWVTFADKGEQGPADLAARLTRAAAQLTPRARARRERADVWPLVDYRDLPVHAPYLEILRASGFQPRAASRYFNRAVVRMPSAQLNQLAAFPFIERMELVAMGLRSETPTSVAQEEVAHVTRPRLQTSALIDYGFALTQDAQINVTAVHDSGYIGTGVLIAMFDEGYNFHDKHQALRDKIIAPGYARDFVQGDSTVTDTTLGFGYNHGTWTMATVGGFHPGTFLGTGYGADFALARTEDGFSETPVEMVNWAMAVEWADSLGADIISSSLGYTQFDDPLDNYVFADLDGKTTIVAQAAQIAASKGILVVNSAGNAGSNAWGALVSPADVHGDSLIAVGAVDSFDVVASFSSPGPTADGRTKPDLAARGVRAYTASASGNPNSYIQLNGTSFSAPIVSGLAACIMQARPNWSPQTVIRALRETASQANSPDNSLGYGIPDGLAALQWTHASLDTPALPPAQGLALELAGPNPMRGGQPLSLRFSSDEQAASATPARLRVFDARGRAVRDLWSGTLAAGEWTTARWNGQDDRGRTLPSGIYWIRLRAGSKTTAVRVVSIR